MMRGVLYLQGAMMFAVVAVMLIGTVTAKRGIEGVRLVNGKVRTEGRLEVRTQAQWGTVCDDYFDDNAARVVCASLGYENQKAITAAKPRAYFGQGTGKKIFLDDVRCTGGEDHINNCRRRTWGTHNCGHREDVGVVCGATEWSRWYDRDNPSGNADGELNVFITDSLPLPCGGATPLYIQVQERVGRTWKNLLTTDVLIHVGPVYGLVCKDLENWWKGGWGHPYCRDFQTKYNINKGGRIVRSPWINRDNPRGAGDYEWGFRKTDKNWTSQGTSIEFRTNPASKVRSHSGIDRFIHVGAKFGVLCFNEENAILGLGRCKDYRARYLCYTRP